MSLWIMYPAVSKLGKVKSQEVYHVNNNTYSIKFQEGMNLHGLSMFKMSDMIHKARDFYRNNRERDEHKESLKNGEPTDRVENYQDSDFETLEYFMC